MRTSDLSHFHFRRLILFNEIHHTRQRICIIIRVMRAVSSVKWNFIKCIDSHYQLPKMFEYLSRPFFEVCLVLLRVVMTSLWYSRASFHIIFNHLLGSSWLFMVLDYFTYANIRVVIRVRKFSIIATVAVTREYLSQDERCMNVCCNLLLLVFCYFVS